MKYKKIISFVLLFVFTFAVTSRDCFCALISNRNKLLRPPHSEVNINHDLNGGKKELKDPKIGISMALIAAIFLALKSFVIKDIIKSGVTPLLVQTYAYLGALILILMIMVIYVFWNFVRKGTIESIVDNDYKKNKIQTKFNREQLIILAFLIIFGQLLASPLNYLSLQYNSVLISEILTGTARPIFIMFIAFLLAMENLTLKKVSGIFVAMLGIMIVIANGTELNWQEVTRIGLLIGFSSAIFYSVNDLTKKKTRDLTNTPSSIFWSYFIAVPILILYLALFGGGFSLVFSWPIVFLSVINFVALALNFYALDYIDTSVNRTISNLAPIFILIGLFLSSWILPDWVTILGVIIAIIGVSIISLSNSSKNIKPAPKINRNTIKLLVNSL